MHQLSKSPDRRAVVSAIIGFHFEKRTAETTWKIAERSCLHRFAATAKPALTLFVGEAYAEGATPLLIISLFYAVTLIQTALSGLLVVLGETMLSLKLTALNSAVGVCLAQLLLPSLGTTGAAITRGVTMATILITTIIALRNKIRLSFDLEACWKSLLVSTVMAWPCTAFKLCTTASVIFLSACLLVESSTLQCSV